jgi:hypothetical protein
MTTKGNITAFAQDDSWIAWADSSRSRTPSILLRNLRTRVTRKVFRHTCDKRVEGINVVAPRTMALARNRVLWTRVFYSGNTQCGASVFTVAPGQRGRTISSTSSSHKPFDPCPPVPMAGDGETLVFAHNSDLDQAPRGVFRVMRKIQRIRGTEGTYALDAVGGVFALARDETVEGRAWSSGDVIWTFPAPRHNSAGIETGKSAVLVRARGAIVGLSVDGRRVAWAEERRGPDVIRALVLPR